MLYIGYVVDGKLRMRHLIGEMMLVEGVDGLVVLTILSERYTLTKDDAVSLAAALQVEAVLEKV